MGQGQSMDLISKFLNKTNQRLNKTESSWHETNLIEDPSEGPFIIKHLLQIDKKSDFNFDQLDREMARINSMINMEKQHPNILQYDKPYFVEKAERKTHLIRQFVCYNLSERIHWLPHLLTITEKKWLVFQFLCSVQQIHSAQVVHGDIKPDNILVTSYDWLFLSDILPYKPVHILDDNLRDYNKYFGHLDNNIRCYTAPERWRSSKDAVVKGAKLEPSMDVFSAGCVIAEIMMDGLPLFDLARLQNHRRGTLDPREELTKKIPDQRIVNLILQMIDREPSARPNISKCLEDWNNEVFPQSFSKVLFHLGAAFQRPSHLYSDHKISLIKYHFDSVYETSAGQYDFSKTLKEPVEPVIYNLLKTSDTIALFDQLQPEYRFYSPSTDAEQMSQRLRPITGDDKESLLIVALWLGKLLNSAFYPQSKLVALEMIQKILPFLPFQTRLNLILPFFKQGFETIHGSSDESQVKCSSTSKIKVKLLQVMLDMFQEIERGGESLHAENEITIEPLDYKVVSAYLLPIVKRQMEGSKSDRLMKLFIAQNLGKIARLGVRILEISIYSAHKKRMEILKHKSQSHFFQFGALRQSQVSKREDLAMHETAQHEDEDSHIPNYDSELAAIWDETENFINTLSANHSDSMTTIAMLKSLVDISDLFAIEKCDFLIQQCLSCINTLKDFRVKLQVIKTLTGMSRRIGMKRIEDSVLPFNELLLEDPEDLVILEDIKMINYLVECRLVSKTTCVRLVDTLLPYSLYPNKQIRLAVATFIHLLSPEVQKTPSPLAISKQCLIDYEDFFTFVRPKFMTYVKEYYHMEVMSNLQTPITIMERLRDPLNLNVMRAWFKAFSAVAPSQYQQMEQQFPMTCAVPMSDIDQFALSVLSSIFTQKLKKQQKEEKVEQHIDIELQGKYAEQMYRVIRQGAIEKLATNSFQQVQQPSEMTEEQRVALVRHYQQDQELPYCTQAPSEEGTNHGLNTRKNSDLCVQSIPYEMSKILQALNVVPQIPETKIFKNTKTREKGDTSRMLRVNTELGLAVRGAQASLIDQFDYQSASQTISVRIGENHKQELKNDKATAPPPFKPQGTLITTLFEHNNPVNTIAVSDDQQYFMTGSKADKKIHVWQMKNIQEDLKSKSVHTLQTNSALNQLCTLQNSSCVAAATAKGIEIFDLERVTLSYSYDSQRPFNDQDQVLCLQSMQSPITYQNILVAAKQSGSVLLYDLRSRQCAINDDSAFKREVGAISAMGFGKDAYTLTIGTIGGYLATYDIRYGVTSALWMHHLNWPILALASYTGNKEKKPSYSSIVSLGGPQHEVCQVNMETGQVELLLRLQSQPTGSSSITKAEIPSVPEFYRETKFKDNKIGTLRRDSTYDQLNKLQLNSSSTSLQALMAREGFRSLDQYYLRQSRLRYKQISEAYQRNDACRAILLPRDSYQSFMFDNDMASYVITAGNDRKIRYWNLKEPESASFQVNTPDDSEVVYLKEQIQKGVTIVVEKQLGQKEFPKYTTQRIKDQISTSEQKTVIKGKTYWIKYPENTSYHNVMATLLQGKVLQTPGTAGGKPTPQPIEWSHVQANEIPGGYIQVNNVCGTSQGQHLNNLAISPDPNEDSTENRISDVVSHQDAILDMALCQDMLITTGRDNLIKVWK